MIIKRDALVRLFFYFRNSGNKLIEKKSNNLHINLHFFLVSLYNNGDMMTISFHNYFTYLMNKGADLD